jgi:hypothetical protein
MSPDRLELLRRRPWRDTSVPEEVSEVPAMLSPLERRLLYTLARDFGGDAAIVDGGSFLGGSTVALLAGVRDRAETAGRPPVVSYDLFRVEAYAIPHFFADDPSVRVGDSFRTRFDANVDGFGVPHLVHEGDIIEIGWSGGPIDILFLDVLKSWRINDAVLRDFFPSLVPGRSVIVHQDYGFGWMPWIPITVELMRDSLRLIDGMEAGSHVFFVEKELPMELLEGGVKRLELAERIEVMDRVVARSEGWVRGMMEIHRASLLLSRDGREAALTDLDRIAAQYSDYPFVLGCLADKKKGLETGWTYGFSVPEPGRRTWTDRVAGARRRIAAALPGR